MHSIDQSTVRNERVKILRRSQQKRSAGTCLIMAFLRGPRHTIASSGPTMKPMEMARGQAADRWPPSGLRCHKAMVAAAWLPAWPSRCNRLRRPKHQTAAIDIKRRRHAILTWVLGGVFQRRFEGGMSTPSATQPHGRNFIYGHLWPRVHLCASVHGKHRKHTHSLLYLLVLMQ